MANLIVDIANTLDPYIQMKAEVPSDHPELGNCLPILDTQVWLEDVGGNQKIRHMYFEKEMASRGVTHKPSALGEREKRASPVQDGVRRLLNTSR